jgi:hypothetical protein
LLELHSGSRTTAVLWAPQARSRPKPKPKAGAAKR